MTENQKLREALQAISHIDDSTNHAVDASAALDRIGQIARQALALPTAAPVGEREAFERTMMDKFGWERKDFKTDEFGYFDGHTVTAWMTWQARAALSAGDAVDGPLIDEGSKPALSPLSDKAAIALIEEHTNDENVIHAHEAIDLIRSVERAHGIDAPHDGEYYVNGDDGVTYYGKTLREALKKALRAKGGKL